MRIEEKEIVIRSAVLEDADTLNGWWNDAGIMEHAGFPEGIRQTMEETRNSIRRRKRPLNELCIIEINGIPCGELSFCIENGIACPGWKSVMRIIWNGLRNQGHPNAL